MQYSASASVALGLPLPAAAQEKAFGFNNDFLAYMPLAGSDRGLLCVNHEYSSPHLMFPGVATDTSEAYQVLTRAQTLSEIALVGHSVIEVQRSDGHWRIVASSRYARRLTPQTPINIDGPVAGHPRLQTSADPSGRTVLGLVGCCSGGKTPWGTVLIAEENFGDVFAGSPAELARRDPEQAERAREYEVDEEHTHWARVDPRFNVLREPNEMNRFGWIVEYDPYDPGSVPVKHTALGRFEHEGATVVTEEGRPVVVYSGDDSEHQCIYRFLSSANYREAEPDANRRLLVDGTLYCARFADDGSASWLPLVFGQGPLTKSNGFTSQADVLLDVRRAAKLLGATPMDRPEGISVDPVSGRVYVALTQNEDREAGTSTNPRAPNLGGHVLELQPPSADHWSDYFNWDIFMLGHARHPDGKHWPCNPDNLLADGRGQLWISTDGAIDFGIADGLWCADLDGPARGVPHQLFACPTGAELCSPEMTPDGRTLFVSVQHPGKDDGSCYDRPSTRWPDFDEAMPPRPAIMALSREDDGFIAA